MITIELVEEGGERPFWMDLNDDDFNDFVEEIAVEWSLRMQEKERRE